MHQQYESLVTGNTIGRTTDDRKERARSTSKGAKAGNPRKAMKSTFIGNDHEQLDTVNRANISIENKVRSRKGK